MEHLFEDASSVVPDEEFGAVMEHCVGVETALWTLLFLALGLNACQQCSVDHQFSLSISAKSRCCLTRELSVQDLE